jgi:hypothetical protein
MEHSKAMEYGSRNASPDVLKPRNKLRRILKEAGVEEFGMPPGVCLVAEFGMPLGVCRVEVGKASQSSIKAAANHLTKLFD